MEMLTRKLLYHRLEPLTNAKCQRLGRRFSRIFASCPLVLHTREIDSLKDALFIGGLYCLGVGLLIGGTYLWEWVLKWAERRHQARVRRQRRGTR